MVGFVLILMHVSIILVMEMLHVKICLLQLIMITLAGPAHASRDIQELER